MFKKLITAVRGHANEMAEEVVDANALTILDQEIRDAKNALTKSKQNLADVKGKRKVNDKKIADIKKKMKQYESQAVQLDENSSLFGEVLERMASLEGELGPLNEISTSFKSAEEKLEASIKKAETHIKQLESQVSIVKANAQAQAARASVTKYAGNTTSLSEARGTLDRIREKQAAEDARLEAAVEVDVGADDLDARLAEEVGSGKTDDIRARILAKKNKG